MNAHAEFCPTIAVTDQPSCLRDGRGIATDTHPAIRWAVESPARIERTSGSLSLIQGQLLRLSEHRAVAIYLREGSTWVADFVDGRGILVDVGTWFRFNCGTLANSHASRRIALESGIPLSAELVAQIETLHRGPEKRRGKPLARMLAAFVPARLWSRLLMRVTGRYRRRRSPQAHSAR